ncbi:MULTISPECIES: GDSL-type esterase/lipase family protein [Parafrankia]|uniref:GDSL-type esterase/lipase family protein n=1 Tax=Parafrankia TaxID=2994362 RepID=UPI001A973C89|nr:MULTISPECIES: GDSL-type esterase/lipase family protein [Parafrankia]
MGHRSGRSHPGWTISQISQIASCTVRTYQPNIVTLHIGTNDMARNVSVAGAPDRLRTLLRRIFEAAPRTTVMLATLIPSTTPATMNRIQAHNAAIRCGGSAGGHSELAGPGQTPRKRLIAVR